jgi:hypothetical protein
MFISHIKQGKQVGASSPRAKAIRQESLTETRKETQVIPKTGWGSLTKETSDGDNNPPQNQKEKDPQIPYSFST